MIEPRPRLRRPRAAALALLALVAGIVLGTAGPASAHATLIKSDPAEGAVLTEAPEQIRFTFDEAVTGVPDGVQVFDAAGGVVGSSSATSGTELEVTLTDPIEGTVVVVWRVVSPDGHPISGSLSFSVGAASEDVVQPPSSAVDTPQAPWSLRLVRWLGYLGLFLATGLVAFAVLFLPTSHLAHGARRRLVVGARVGAVIAGVAWLIVLPIVAAYQVGGGVGSLAKGSTWSALATTEYAVTAVVVVGVALAVGLLGHGLPPRPRGLAAVAVAAIAAGAPALTGHTRAATPQALVVGADVLHLLAAAVWLGGLVALALTLRDLAARGTMGAEVLVRFSTVAAGVLGALVVTGAVLTWRILGSWSALFQIGYGQLLLVKLGVALIAVAIATWNRFALLDRLQQANRRRDRRAGSDLVVRTTTVEAVVLVAVLLVTGLLVDRSPEADAAAAAARSEVQTAMLGPYEVEATLSPTSTGPTTVTVETRDFAGEPIEGIEAPRVSLSSGEVDLGEVPVVSVAPGAYAADVVLPSPGTWQVQVSLRTSEFDNPVTTLQFIVE